MLLLPFKKWACKRYAGLLVPYNERTLPSPERSLVAAHLRVCASCRDEVTHLALMSDLLRANPPSIPNADLWSSLEAQIRSIPQESPSPISLPSYPARRGWGLSASHAGLVAATLVLGVIFYRHSPAPADMTQPATDKKNLVALLPREAQQPLVLKPTEATRAPLVSSALRPASVSVRKPTRLREDAAPVRLASISRKERSVLLSRPTTKPLMPPKVLPVKAEETKVALLPTNVVMGARWGIESASSGTSETASEAAVNTASTETEGISTPAIQRTVPATAAFASTGSESSERQQALFSYSGG